MLITSSQRLFPKSIKYARCLVTVGKMLKPFAIALRDFLLTLTTIIEGDIKTIMAARIAVSITISIYKSIRKLL